MISRAKTAIDPPAPHFGVESRAAELRNGAPDYLEGANFYQRRILDVERQGATPSARAGSSARAPASWRVKTTGW